MIGVASGKIWTTLLMHLSTLKANPKKLNKDTAMCFKNYNNVTETLKTYDTM